MNVSLTPHFDEYISQKLASGKYHSASEVIREALRLMEERDANRQAQLEFMRSEIQKGIDSGAATDWNKDDFLAKARKRAGLEAKG